MRTIAIINQKGGCGKTTTSINLSACLARLGQKTLLVDMDPQGHCAVGLAVPEEQIERTILNALIEERDGKPAKLAEVVWQIASDFDLAPSDIRLAAFEQLFAGRLGREDRLKKAIESVRPTYKWCIVDCPPSVGLITFNALRACDEVIVPVETGYFSLHGLTKMMETLEVLREKCGKEILIRVLPTLYDTRTKLAREVLSELRNKFKEYLMESTVNFNTKLKEAASFGQPITEYDPGSRGYKDFVNLARELMGHQVLDQEPTPLDKLSRPAELVQRAKQLSQLTNLQFGRNNGGAFNSASAAAAPAAGTSFGTMAPAATGTTGLPPSFTSSTIHSSTFAGNGSVSAALARGEMQVGGRIADLTPNVASFPMSSSAEEIADGAIETRMRIVGGVAEVTSGVPVVGKTTDQKIEEFYGVKRVGDEILFFAAQFKQAKKVLIAGDFNNWSPMSTPMMNVNKSGNFSMQLPLQPGRYRYRFIVDGKWMTDPNNTYVEANQFGELNNVIDVD